MRFKKYLEFKNVTNYANVKVRISEGQKDKLRKAFESNCESITIRLKFTDLHGEEVIAITISQLDKLMKAYEAKEGLIIKMSKNTIGLQHENTSRIFTNVDWIDPILNMNCLTSFKGWSIIGTGKYGCSKANRK